MHTTEKHLNKYMLIGSLKKIWKLYQIQARCENFKLQDFPHPSKISSFPVLKSLIKQKRKIPQLEDTDWLNGINMRHSNVQPTTSSLHQWKMHRAAERERMGKGIPWEQDPKASRCSWTPIRRDRLTNVTVTELRKVPDTMKESTQAGVTVNVSGPQASALSIARWASERLLYNSGGLQTPHFHPKTKPQPRNIRFKS